ncbi:hypothetical protein C461_03277 [Halorubrum aidingense JCM 13560]|uniref:Uncharacterized protein n=1 Tax=Halorubrum aidingense JCM 13560 TaxID=1230454 RepID=M0PHT2_9EURY|nr:hypothetical protein [Halorubrum aidingense]EMA69164.1 hypothetical protein C461_03277 [Halorubrum aidingense JCM 13560]
MPTSFLTREEMHDRVDVIFDEIEAELVADDDEPIALIGQLVGNLSVRGPHDGEKRFEADPSVAFAHYAFPNGDSYALGAAFRDLPNRELVSTVIVAKSSLHPTLAKAIDGDEDARESVANGELLAADGGGA